MLCTFPNGSGNVHGTWNMVCVTRSRKFNVFPYYYNFFHVVLEWTFNARGLRKIFDNRRTSMCRVASWSVEDMGFGNCQNFKDFDRTSGEYPNCRLSPIWRLPSVWIIRLGNQGEAKNYNDNIKLAHEHKRIRIKIYFRDWYKVELAMNNITNSFFNQTRVYKSESCQSKLLIGRILLILMIFRVMSALLDNCWRFKTKHFVEYCSPD